MYRSFLLLLLLFYTACSNEKTYEHIQIKEDLEIFTYSCEKNFSEFNTTIQAEKAHLFLFKQIEKESHKISDSLFKDNTIREERSFVEWLKFIRNIIGMQSHIEQSAKNIIDEFGCALIKTTEE